MKKCMHLWRVWILVFNEFFTKTLHFLDTSGHASAILDDLFFAVEPETIRGKGWVCTRSGGGSEVILVESD